MIFAGLNCTLPDNVRYYASVTFPGIWGVGFMVLSSRRRILPETRKRPAVGPLSGAKTFEKLATVLAFPTCLPCETQSFRNLPKRLSADDIVRSSLKKHLSALGEIRRIRRWVKLLSF